MLIGARGKFIKYWSRAETGSICFVDDFDKKIYWPKLKEITKRYGIEYRPDQQIPLDDDMLDRLWQAGIDLVLEVGVLCVDTRRIIEFSREEIMEMVDNVEDSFTLGRNLDTITPTHRGFEDYDHIKNPVFVMGRILGPVTRDVYQSICLSYAQVPEMDFCHFQGNLQEIYHMKITPGSPWEMLAEIWSANQIKDACRQACRGGLADGGIRAIDFSAIQAAMDPGWGISSGDFGSCLTLPHQKVEYKHLLRAIQCFTKGIPNWSGLVSYPGGLSGGPASSAVTGVAEWITEKMLFGTSIMGSWSVDAMYFSNTSKLSLWTSNHQNAAVIKNTHCAPLAGGGWQMTHGLGSEEYFWESAASAMSAVVLGCGVVGGTACQSAGVNHQGGLGLQFGAQVAEAVAKAKLNRAQVNDLVNQCQAKYQGAIDNHTAHTIGADYTACYDVETATPQKWYLDLCNKVKKELNVMGVPVKISE